MELYAAGFNAWGQLNFQKDETSTTDDEPEDLRSFSLVLQEDHIASVEAFLTYTYGGIPHVQIWCAWELTHIAPKVNKFSKPISAGCIPELHRELLDLRAREENNYYRFAVASNSDVVVVGTDSGVRHYPKIQAGGFRERALQLRNGAPFSVENKALIRIISNVSPVRQLLAYETGFVVLSNYGDVFTWGDERYAACLGRDVDARSPADKPSLVRDLTDLPTGPIVKIAANGYTLAALTSGNDLYCWGGHPAQLPIIEGLTGYPTPVVIGDYDIADIGVGESHMIALTTDGQVFVIGDNKNGQLGLNVERATDWTRVVVDLDVNQKVKNVTAGPRNSFVVVEREKTL